MILIFDCTTNYGSSLSSCVFRHAWYLSFPPLDITHLQAMADEGELEGLDKAIAWIKSIYIFGLFEGETGQEAPWYLKPVRIHTAPL